jgi:hypothetical protein
VAAPYSSASRGPGAHVSRCRGSAAAAATSTTTAAARGCGRAAAATHRDRAQQLDGVVVPVGATGGVGCCAHRAADLEGRAALPTAELVAGHPRSLRRPAPRTQTPAPPAPSTRHRPLGPGRTHRRGRRPPSPPVHAGRPPAGPPTRRPALPYSPAHDRTATHAHPHPDSRTSTARHTRTHTPTRGEAGRDTPAPRPRPAGRRGWLGWPLRLPRVWPYSSLGNGAFSNRG